MKCKCKCQDVREFDPVGQHKCGEYVGLGRLTSAARHSGQAVTRWVGYCEAGSSCFEGPYCS